MGIIREFKFLNKVLKKISCVIISLISIKYYFFNKLLSNIKRILVVLISFINLGYAQNIEFYDPSFNCNNVKKDSIEYLICTDENLSKQDKELNEIYKMLSQIIVEKKELIKEQKEFLLDRKDCNKNKLDKNYCIRVLYEKRIYILNSIYKFINLNLDGYKLERIKYVDIKNFIYLYEIKSKLFVNKLLNIISIFEKNNYILVEDGFLIRFYDVKFSNGIYYANIKTGKVERIIGGTINDWFIIKNHQPTKVIFKSIDGFRGLGYQSINSITINDDGSIEKKVILEAEYDMESGLCNRAEILGISKAGDIVNFEYDEINNLLKIDFIEQDCLNKEISNQKLFYDLEKNIFITTKDKK